MAKIREHHQQAIRRLAEAYQSDANFLALLIGGSVAKGYARENSDVDFMLVATDQEYERRLAARDLLVTRFDLTDYPDGYVDGKIINRPFLETLAENGNEPSRAAFIGVQTAFSRMPDLPGLLDKILAYPEEDRENRMKAFYCLAFVANWFMSEAERHNNPYLKLRAASQLSLFACRLILAYNRMLYPFHKWLLRAIAEAPDKPVDFEDKLNELMAQPSQATANAFFQSVRDFRDWGMADQEAFTWFMTEVEWSWRNRFTPIEDW